MTIKIFVFDYLTKKTLIDSSLNINSDDMEILHANHKAFRELNPDCQVNFVVDEKNFIFSPPINMELDEQAYSEGRITWNEYISKWYTTCPALLEEDESDIVTIERYEAEDFASRDSVCY